MKFWLLLLALGFYFGATGESYAYLDPGTGSMLLQALLASVAAVLVTMKFYWHKVRRFFTRLVNPRSRGERAPSEGSAE